MSERAGAAALFPPPPLADRPVPVALITAVAGPLVLGAIVGVLLGVSAGAYIALSVLAIGGGVLGGMEHRTPRGAALRGVLGGVLFGTGILLVDALTGAKRQIEVPHPAILLLLLTTLPAVPLHLLGWWLARRRAAA